MTEPLDASGASSIYGAPSFSLANRVTRAVWTVVWTLLASWTPAPFGPWRRILLRLFGARIGHKAQVYGSARIWYPPNLEMGAYACLGRDVNCYCQGQITLEPFALVSQYAHLVSGTHDFEDPDFQLITRPIRIGAHAWVAAGAFVGPGVQVGEGAVLGARAVAFKDLEAWTVYAGNPAVALRARKNIAQAREAATTGRPAG